MASPRVVRSSRSRLGRAAAAAIVVSVAAVDASALSVDQVPNPRGSGGWVSDGADMLPPAIEGELNAMITAAEQELSVEIAVVTVDEVDTATPKDFATKLFNHWGVGKQATNNGMLVLMVKSERRLEMETGYGLETVLTDGWLKTMQERDMVPRFKEGDYGEGIKTGVSQSIERLRVYQETGELEEPEPVDLMPFWAQLLIGGSLAAIPLSIGGVIGVKRKRWRDARKCPDCHKMMVMLPDAEDDVHLSEGQKTEESIGSIDWEYWYCETCEDSHKLIEVSQSGYSTCPECENKTLASTSTTLVSPTYHGAGTASVVSTCAHCEHHSETTAVLPMLVAATTSSSSYGGGSFGGGSSGGGGAGSSW